MDFLQGDLFINILGYITVALLFVSFQMNDRKGILGFMTLAMVFLITHQFLLGALAGAAACSLTIVRNLFFRYKNDQPIMHHIMWPYLFSVVMLGTSYYFWQGWYSLLPALGVIVSTFALWADNPKTIRLWSLVAPLLWLPYAVIVESLPTVMIQLVVLSSILIAMFRFDL